ncbi:MAG: hypothetical protein HY685_05205 [Chloroflexi bacterium]|nr:hypothetical protein [Chloroflexota bacterium]
MGKALRKPLFRLAFAFVAGALLLAPLPRLALANGGSFPIFADTVGPYRVVVGVAPRSPTVGFVHLSIVLADAKIDIGVTDAIVTIVGKLPGVTGADVGPVGATSSFFASSIYDANVPLGEEGEWALAITVSRPFAQTPVEPVVFTVPLRVSKAGGLEGGGLVLVGAVLVAGAAVGWFLRSKTLRQRPSRR